MNVVAAAVDIVVYLLAAIWLAIALAPPVLILFENPSDESPDGMC
jgi:hypothetical protein